MAHRPYPNADRALKQLDRHYPPAPVIPMSPALRSAGDAIGQLRKNAPRAAGLRRGHLCPVDAAEPCADQDCRRRIVSGHYRRQHYPPVDAL